LPVLSFRLPLLLSLVLLCLCRSGYRSSALWGCRVGSRLSRKGLHLVLSRAFVFVLNLTAFLLFLLFLG
jgi:hypothetical protein